MRRLFPGKPAEISRKFSEKAFLFSKRKHFGQNGKPCRRRLPPETAGSRRAATGQPAEIHSGFHQSEYKTHKI